LPHDRRRRFKPNADAAAFVDISALGGNSPDNIFRSYRSHLDMPGLRKPPFLERMPEPAA
jgi:hypothetical protein